MLAVLAPHVPSLSTVDRVGVIGDAFALAVGGYSSTVTALELLQHYSSETQYIVWAEITQRCVHDCLFGFPLIHSSFRFDACLHAFTHLALSA
jgi:hypothetical protein